MIYRRKTYIVASAVVEEFNALFNEILLPAQLKYGARLIGRWHAPVDEETSEIFAVWEYDTMDQYEEIERSIKADAEHVARVQERYARIGKDRIDTGLRQPVKQQFFESTVERSRTILAPNE